MRVSWSGVTREKEDTMRRTLFWGRDDHGEFSTPVDYEGTVPFHAVHILGEWLTREGLRLTMWAEHRLRRVPPPSQTGRPEHRRAR
jgi:hypothetical protein